MKALNTKAEASRQYRSKRTSILSESNLAMELKEPPAAGTFGSEITTTLQEQSVLASLASQNTEHYLPAMLVEDRSNSPRQAQPKHILGLSCVPSQPLPKSLALSIEPVRTEDNLAEYEFDFSGPLTPAAELRQDSRRRIGIDLALRGHQGNVIIFGKYFLVLTPSLAAQARDGSLRIELDTNAKQSLRVRVTGDSNSAVGHKEAIVEGRSLGRIDAIRQEIERLMQDDEPPSRESDRRSVTWTRRELLLAERRNYLDKSRMFEPKETFSLATGKSVSLEFPTKRGICEITVGDLKRVFDANQRSLLNLISSEKNRIAPLGFFNTNGKSVAPATPDTGADLQVWVSFGKGDPANILADLATAVHRAKSSERSMNPHQQPAGAIVVLKLSEKDIPASAKGKSERICNLWFASRNSTKLTMSVTESDFPDKFLGIILPSAIDNLAYPFNSSDSRSKDFARAQLAQALQAQKLAVEAIRLGLNDK